MRRTRPGRGDLVRLAEAPAGEGAGREPEACTDRKSFPGSGSTRRHCSQTTSRACSRHWTRAWPRPSMRRSSPSSPRPAAPPESGDSYLMKDRFHARKNRKVRRRMARSAHPRAIPRPAREGDRARVHRQVLEHQDAGHLPLRRLRSGAVQRGREVRLAERLAQLHPADRRRAGRGARGPQPRHGADRSDLRPLWLAPRVTSSPTAPRRPVCATVSTRFPSSWSRRRP